MRRHVQATPAYWDVTYQHEGIEHRVQVANQPGRTIAVNRRASRARNARRSRCGAA